MVQSTSTRNEEEAKLVKTLDTITPWRIVSPYLTDSNDSNDMTVDGTGGSPQVFNYTPPANYDFAAARMMIYMECSSAMSTTVFGNLAAALAVGIEVKAQGVLLTTWKDNIDIYTQAFDVDTLANVSDATVDTTFNVRWSFFKDANDRGIEIDNGEFFEAIINDDLSSITVLRMRIHGHLDAARTLR